jgi:uncharacterized protein (TIGR02391 family)
MNGIEPPLDTCDDAGNAVLDGLRLRHRYSEVDQLTQNNTLEHLDELIGIGEAVVASRRAPGPRVLGPAVVDPEKFEKWRVSSMSFLSATFGDSSIYFKEFTDKCKFARHDNAVVGLSVLRAVKADLLRGTGAAVRKTGNLEALPLNPRIRDVCLDLYRDGHYASAVLEASKALINYVKEKSRRDDLDGADLMRTVFTAKRPILSFDTDEGDQEGVMHLFEGAVLAIRNPRGHDFPDDTPERAQEYISFISLLANLVQEARRTDAG